MKQKHLPRLLSLLLLVATLISTLAISASAATLGDSNSVTVKSKGREEYLSKSTGGTIGSGLWTFTSNDGLTGTAYCVNWGLTGVSPNKALTLQPYNRNPKTMGAFSNGYPQRTLEQFKEINEGSIRGLADLTEDEYQYATQIAVWATCGQLSVPGTTFTAGRAALVEPTSDAQEIRIYDSVKAILAKTSGWDQHFYPGMYLRAEEDRDVRGVEIINELGLAGAADDGDEGIQKETINGVEYYTRVLYVASATSTWIDGYTTKVYSTDAPQGTIFTAENGSALETVQENGTTYYKVDTSASRNTNLNANGQEYYGAFKVCIPVASAADEGSFTIKATGGIAQFNLFLAYNPSATEQSYIVADPAYTTGNASMPFKWSYTGQTGPASLQVVKTDGAGAPLEGAEFTLSGSGGTVVTGTSDRNGQIIWRDLPAEEVYTLVEDRAPEGYRIVEPMNITLTAGQTAYVTVKNHVENSFKLKKIDAQNKGSLQGAVFVFEQIDGTYKTTGITGFDGVIEFVGDELPYGSYRVTEQSSSPGYVKSDRVETIAWDGTKDVTIVWENTRDISLTIVKVDEQSGISLPNATFDVYADGEYFTSVTTNDAGEAYVSGIKKEAYIEVVETASPQGYVLDRTSHGIHIDPYDPATEEDPVLVVTNRARPALRIVKYDAQSMQPLADTTFEVYHDGNLLGEYTTDYNGEIFLYDLDPGTYLIKEIATKDSHVVNSTPQQIELKAGATSTYSVVFLNYLKPGMHLVKLDSQSMKPLPNVRFRISQVGGDFSKEFVTDINGEIDLSALEPSAYLVEELEAPDGYLIDDASRVIQLEPGVNAQFVFTNTREPSLRLIKRSSDGTPLEGVTFRIARIEDGSRYLDRVTDENGEINIHDLEPGVYSVLEVATVNDHIVDPIERHVELFPGETSTIVLENNKRPNLYVYKWDADTGEPIPNTVFLVEAADGHSVDEIKTDANGRAELKNLLPGVYKISEKSVPSPWLMDAEPQLVTLYPNRDHTVYFENHKKPSVTIIKEDAISGTLLKNAKFSIQWASNKSATGEIRDLGIHYTDSQGRIVLEGLEDGWLKLTELEPPSGYAIQGSGVHEEFIRGGESKTIRIKNTPLSALVVWKYDSVSGLALEGAVFQVKYLSGTSGSGGTVIGTFKTGPSGGFTVTGLEAGAYVVEELASDGDHVIDTAPQTAYISGEEQAVVQLYFGNAPKGALLVKKVSSDGTPLSDVQFFVTESDGTVVGDGNGYFTTDSSGSFLIEGITPGTTLVVKETRAKPGYLLDGTPQTATIQAGQTVSLEFRNQPTGGLIIYKQSTVDKTPLEGVQFKITYADGKVVDAQGGKISSNGLYFTDKNGQIRIDGIVGTVVVTEVETIPGYVIHEATRSQTVTINPDDTQTLYFYNTPSQTLTIQKFIEGTNNEPLAGVRFLVTTSSGEVVGPNNGYYTTDASGRIVITGLNPGVTVTAREVKTVDGYVLDGTPQSILIKEGEAQSMTFYNKKAGGLIIHKLSSTDKTPLEGVQFKITYADGKVVDAEGGKLSSNGLYWTDKNGQIKLDGVTGTLVVTEVETIPGYTIHEETRSQTVIVNPDDVQTLYFYNDPIGGVEIVKVNEADKTERIPNTTFEIRKVDDELIDTVTTDKNGRVFVPLEDGAYYAVEIEAAEGFKLDNTPHYFEVENGKTVLLQVTNQAFSGILIHKVDSVTGDGVYGVTFLLYDASKTPIGQYVSDQDGWVYIDDLPASGRYYLRELEAEGYIVDEQLKTVYVTDGTTTEIVWENTPITGQIQITKTSADYNSMNGWPAGTPIPNTVFEVYHYRTGNLVDTIQTDKNGVAVTKPLPLGRYKIVEAKAADFYGLDKTPIDVEIEHAGQIVKAAMTNKSLYTNVSIKKVGYTEVMPGQSIRYDFSGIANNSTTALTSFYWRDTLPTNAVRLDKIVTGTYNVQGNYKIVYKTNLSNGAYRTLADNLSTMQNYVLDASPAALGLAANEFVTEFMVSFGVVPANFRQVEAPRVYCNVVSWLTGGTQFVNQADVGGVYNGQWIMATTRWVTTVYKPSQPLPRTGY